MAIDDLWKALRSLGYYDVKVQERRSEWRRGRFHLHTYPWAKKGIELALHIDVWKKGSPAFSHGSRGEGRDLEQELGGIEKRYREMRETT